MWDRKQCTYYSTHTNFFYKHISYNSLWDIQQHTYYYLFFTNTPHTTVYDEYSNAHTTVHVLANCFFATTTPTSVCEIWRKAYTNVFFTNTVHTTIYEIHSNIHTSVHLLTFCYKHRSYICLWDTKPCTYYSTCSNYFTDRDHATVFEVWSSTHSPFLFEHSS